MEQSLPNERHLRTWGGLSCWGPPKHIYFWPLLIEYATEEASLSLQISLTFYMFRPNLHVFCLRRVLKVLETLISQKIYGYCNLKYGNYGEVCSSNKTFLGNFVWQGKTGRGIPNPWSRSYKISTLRFFLQARFA